MRKSRKSHNNNGRKNHNRNNKNKKLNQTKQNNQEANLEKADAFIKAIEAKETFKYLKSKFSKFDKTTINQGYRINESIKSGARIETNCTLLMYAIEKLNVDAVKFLLTKGANPNAIIKDNSEANSPILIF